MKTSCLSEGLAVTFENNCPKANKGLGNIINRKGQILQYWAAFFNFLQNVFIQLHYSYSCSLMDERRCLKECLPFNKTERKVLGLKVSTHSQAIFLILVFFSFPWAIRPSVNVFQYYRDEHRLKGIYFVDTTEKL